mmetsp:Transcript_10417/g.33314  ORF Transcript_10417/g.33314 Transcript_10417/m.33314 type:complete len:168 (-) Transcript_10417:28-531(-)
MLCLALAAVSAQAFVSRGTSKPRGRGLYEGKVDPNRPRLGSPAPAIINALATGKVPSDETTAGIVKSVATERLHEVLERVVAEATWVAKYHEEGRFGLPLDSTDPLVALQRAECVLALHLILNHGPSAAIPATETAAALRASDFIEADRLEVLLLAATTLDDDELRR